MNSEQPFAKDAWRPPSPITADELLGALEAVLAEVGKDYVYPPAARMEKCRYVDKDGGCFIGRALRRLGASEEALRDSLIQSETSFGELYDVPTNTSAASRLPREWLSESAAMLANLVQSQQDDGIPWGQALAFGRANYSNPFAFADDYN